MMLFELTKEEASSLICTPHWTYGCLTSRQSLYFILLFYVPLEGVARFTFICKFDCLHSCNISHLHEHSGVVQGTNMVSTWPSVKSTEEEYWGTNVA